MVDDAIRFVFDKQKEKIKSSSIDSNEESREPAYDEERSAEGREEESDEMTSTNQVF